LKYFLSFILPSKANRVKIKSKRYVIPKEVSIKINRAIWELRLQQEKYKITFNVPVEVNIKFILPNKRRRDIDNIMKTLGDCMVYANIITDDHLIYKQNLEKIIVPGEEGIIIDIKEYKSINNFNKIIDRLKKYKEKLDGLK